MHCWYSNIYTRIHTNTPTIWRSLGDRNSSAILATLTNSDWQWHWRPCQCSSSDRLPTKEYKPALSRSTKSMTTTQVSTLLTNIQTGHSPCVGRDPARLPQSKSCSIWPGNQWTVTVTSVHNGTLSNIIIMLVVSCFRWSECCHMTSDRFKYSTQPHGPWKIINPPWIGTTLHTVLKFRVCFHGGEVSTIFGGKVE